MSARDAAPPREPLRDPSGTSAMDPEELRAIGVRLNRGRIYGWQTKLARELRRDSRVVRRWYAGAVGIQPDTAERIRDLDPAPPKGSKDERPGDGRSKDESRPRVAFHRRWLLLLAHHPDTHRVREAEGRLVLEVRGTDGDHHVVELEPSPDRTST